MAKEKYCPLTFTIGPVVSDFSYCREKSCAWWDDITGFCAITVIARFGTEGSFYVQRQERKADLIADRGEAK